MAEAEFLIVETIYPGMTQLDFTAPHTVFSRIPGASHCAWEGALIREVVRADLGIPTIEFEVPPICDAMLPTLASRLQAVLEIAKARR